MYKQGLGGPVRNADWDIGDPGDESLSFPTRIMHPRMLADLCDQEFWLEWFGQVVIGWKKLKMSNLIGVKKRLEHSDLTGRYKPH